MIRIAIIEDHPSTREGLQRIIEKNSLMEVSAAVGTVEEFDARSRDGHDVVILDLRLGGDGLEGASAVSHLCDREFLVLVVSASGEEVPVLDAIGAGAKGYLTKEAEPDEIVRAIEMVAAGRPYISPTVAGLLLKDHKSLTQRERDVLRLVAQGETSKEVAKILLISEKAVNSCLDRIRNKTDCRRRSDLTRLAIERGVIRQEGSRGSARDKERK